MLKQIESGVVRFPVSVAFLDSGTARLTVDEERRLQGNILLRHGSKAQKRRYNEAEKWTISGDLTPSKKATSLTKDGITTVQYGAGQRFEATIRHYPFTVEFGRDGQTHIQLNGRGFLNIEHWREKKEHENAKQAVLDIADQDSWWEESFGGFTDSKPRGPESIALDVVFNGYEHVYGIPEHASSLSLKETTGGKGQYVDPYRLFNTDVFEYEVDSPMTLYGAIPFMQAQRVNSSVGVFWLNGADTWIDIAKTSTQGAPKTQTHWISESGILDIFIFLGPTPKDVISSYTSLTGTTQMPQEFAVAHHQCRWNYVSDDDIVGVAKRFDRHSIPVDALWLDIEYTDSKKYFTWDRLNFKDVDKMHRRLDAVGRKQIVIVDPHIKDEADYDVVDQLKAKDLAVKTSKEDSYRASCWPGQSYWIDCFNPAAVTWWKSLFRYDTFQGTFPNTWLWNDMNEPSVFGGPEATMPKDNIHFGGWENRDVHNINGLTYHEATYQALLARSRAEEKSPRRPFILTRAYFAGSQRTSAAWTGDNTATWEHLAASIPMILTNGIAGYPFIGADVPGYFGNPSDELLARWYQAGAFYPFFRAHAHIDTRRREPYVIEEPYRSVMANAIRLRYQLLPAWYTAFRHAAGSGEPIVRPNYYVHPEDSESFGIDSQMYLGSTGILVRPVVEEGAKAIDVYLADDEVYYDYWDFVAYSGKGRHTVPAPLEKVPMLMRGGHIFPRKDRLRRSSALMRHDPITLVVVLSQGGDANGELYMDDGETFQYEQGAYVHRRFVFDGKLNTLKSENFGEEGKLAKQYEKTVQHIKVERIIVVGVPDEWASKAEVNVNEEGSAPIQVTMTYHQGRKGQLGWAVVRNPGRSIVKDWKVEF